MTGTDDVLRPGLDRLIASPVETIGEIFLLRYIPRYLDILPVYIVILALVPVAMLLAKIDRRSRHRSRCISPSISAQ